MITLAVPYRLLGRVLAAGLVMALILTAGVGLAAAQGGDDLTHTIQAGETLAEIAALYDVTLATLMQANDITNPDLIIVGDVLTIPAADPSADSAADPLDASPTGETAAMPAPGGTPAPAQAGMGIYVVQPGDTIHTIATAFNVAAAELIAANFAEGENPGLIFPGQVLLVPGGAVDGQGGGGAPDQTYTVQYGDMLESIAQAFNVAIESIGYANDLPRPYRIYPGDVLVIPGNAPPFGVVPPLSGEVIAVPASSGVMDGQGGGSSNVYVVQVGDTLASIAVALDVDMADLLAANPGLLEQVVLTPGTELVVP